MYVREGPPATDVCCCGNRFVVGSRAGLAEEPPAGFERQTSAFIAPWDEELVAVWDLGAGVHDADKRHHNSHGDASHDASP
jgi:hypothetical protein